jgi:apolipoprotein N-acyltransferase
MIRVTLLSPLWRLVSAILVALALVTLPTYVAALVLLPPVPPIVMIRSFVLGTAIPAATAWAIARLFAGTATVRDGRLRLTRGDLDVDVPCTAIAAVRPWWIPLPMPGVTLRIRSGRRLPFGIALSRPGEMADALGSGAARRHPSLIWASTRPVRRWRHALVKFVVFGAVPAGIVFYTHQHIAYGGPLGQWYLESPRAYLATLAAYWATTVILLASYASVWRGAGELAVWMVAAARPSSAPAARRAVEATCALAYYGGVVALLALRYAA